MDIIYYIINNDQKLFKVIIKLINQKFVIYKKDDNTNDYTKFVYENHYENIFIDKIILNDKNESENIYHIGGILFEMRKNENIYIFVGDEISQFKSLDKMEYIMTLIGNDNFVYPYGIDKENNIYLFIENIMIKHNSNISEIIKKTPNPYDFYYEIDTLNGKYKTLLNYDIKYLSIKGEICLFYHQLDPSKAYQKLTNNSQNQIYIIDMLNKKRKITKSEYISINKTWNDFFGLNSIIDYEIIDN